MIILNKNQIAELSDENGEVVAHYEYSPFGSLTMVTGNYAENNPFRFSSEYFDEETGLVYYNYRYYNPELGRWISRDPIEEQGGFNLYGMIGNNPLHGWDKLGKELCDNCKRQQEQDYWDAFRDGFGDSLLKQFESFTGFWADLFTGKGTENWYEYGEKSAYGQAEQIGGWTEIGKKTALGVASVSAISALGVIATGYTSKVAIHGAHHTLGSWGKLSHLQINLWKVGVKGSSKVLRIPLPWK